MSRDSFRQGADDAQLWGKPNTGPYLMDPSYAEGFDSYMKEHPLCSKCDEDAQPDTDPPMCAEHLADKEWQERKHLISQSEIDQAKRNDPETEEITHLMFINRDPKR